MMQRLRDALRRGRSIEQPHRQYRPNELSLDEIRAERLRREAWRVEPAASQPGRSLEALGERSPRLPRSLRLPDRSRGTTDCVPENAIRLAPGLATERDSRPAASAARSVERRLRLVARSVCVPRPHPRRTPRIAIRGRPTGVQARCAPSWPLTDDPRSIWATDHGCAAARAPTRRCSRSRTACRAGCASLARRGGSGRCGQGVSRRWSPFSA